MNLEPVIQSETGSESAEPVAWVRSLVGELRSHQLHVMVKKRKKRNPYKANCGRLKFWPYIKMCILSYVKQIASPGLMHDTGCSGLVHWNDPEGWFGREVGGGFRMGNTCTPVADSCQCMAEPIQYCN